MGIYNTNQQWTTYRILDASILNVDVATAAAIDFTKLGPTGALTVGASGAGYDVTLYGDNAGSDFLWDQNGDSNIGLLSLGATGGSKGVEFIVYGATNGNSLQWDQSADDLLLVGTATQLAVAGTTDSSNPTSGSLRTAGGLGVAMAANIGTTLGIAGLITSTSVTGFRSNPTFVPDANRTNYAIAIGYGHAATYELNVTMAAAATQNLDPIALNLNIIGANPTGSSTINGIYQNITHDTIDMANLRLKCADWNVVIGKNVLDAYCYQGEIDYTAAVAVGGESAVLGLVMRAYSSAMTGNLRGIIISMEGAGMPANAIGIELRSTAGAGLGSGLAEGIRISGTPLTQVGIAMGNQTNNNEGPQYAFFFPSTGSPDTGCWSATNASGDAGKIAIKIGTNTRYINVYTS